MIRQAREYARRVRPTPRSRLSRVRTDTARPAAAGSWRARITWKPTGTTWKRTSARWPGSATAACGTRGTRTRCTSRSRTTTTARWSVAIVCDGVSSAPRPDEASWTAVNTGITLLAEGAERGDDPARDRPGRRSRPPGQALTGTGRPGRRARRDVRVRGRHASGRSRCAGSATAAPTGSPRTRRIPAGPNDTIDITGGSRRVTRDDSLAEEIVAAGPRVHGRGDGLTAGARDHPLARRRPARPRGARRAVHPDRARRAAAVLRRAVELPPGGRGAGRHGACPPR